MSSYIGRVPTQAERINAARRALEAPALQMPPVAEVPDVPSPSAEPRRPAAGGVFRGAWQPSTQYGKLDLVTHGGKLYAVDETFVTPAVFDEVGLTNVTATGTL